MKTDYYVKIKTDTYTGNIDAFLCGLLFKLEDELERSGQAEGREQWKDLGVAIPEVDSHPEADDPMFCYKPDFGNDENTLEVAFYYNPIEYVKALSSEYTGKTVVYTENYGDFVDKTEFTILGFEVIEDIVVTTRKVLFSS